MLRQRCFGVKTLKVPFLLYRKYRVTLKYESCASYRAKSPPGQGAHLAERKLMLCIPLGRVSVRQAHTLFIYHISGRIKDAKKV